MPYGKSNDLQWSNTSLAVSALPETKRLVVQAVMGNLFEKSYFDICTIDKVCKIIGSRKAGEAYNLLSALHCVDYSAMSPELRERIPHLVNECLRQQEKTELVRDVALDGIVYE